VSENEFETLLVNWKLRYNNLVLIVRHSTQHSLIINDFYFERKKFIFLRRFDFELLVYRSRPTHERNGQTAEFVYPIQLLNIRCYIKPLEYINHCLKPGQGDLNNIAFFYACTLLHVGISSTHILRNSKKLKL